jgi:hypothetical protein
LTAGIEPARALAMALTLNGTIFPDFENNAGQLELKGTIAYNGVNLACQLVNCGDQTDDVMSGYGLKRAYTVWLLLAVLYFWERGPWHRSQAWEQTYLIILYAGLYVVTCIWLFGTDVPIEYGNNQLIGLVLFLVVIIHLIKTQASYPLLPDFYSKPGARQLAKKRPSPTPVGVYAVRVINDSLPHFCAQDGNDTSFVYKILFILMVQYVTVSTGEKWFTRMSALVILSLFVLEALVVGPSSVMKFFKARKAAHKVADIFKKIICEQSCADSLYYVLANVSLASVFLSNPRVIELFSEDALENQLLDVRAKAIVLDALQTKHMGQKRDQKAALKMIKSCHGNDLTVLKDLCDGSGGFHNFYKLVYSDMTHHHLREELIDHVREEGDAVRKQSGRHVAIKVLSDVDDTLNCSGGPVAGADKTYPKKAVYPGCTAFYEAILTGEKTTASVDLVFLSARPHIYKGYAENGSYALFRSLVETGQLHTYPTLLPGQLRSSTFGGLFWACMKNKSWRMVGEDKYKTFVKYRQLYREYNFVFCGDDGQGDLLAGEKMVNEELEDEEELGPHVSAVVIHKVLKDAEPLAETDVDDRDSDWEDELKEKGLFFHTTYVGAAVDVFKKAPNVLKAHHVVKIANDAIDHFDNLRNLYPDWDPELRDQAEEELQADLNNAVAVTRSMQGLPSIKRIPPYDNSQVWSILPEE